MVKNWYLSMISSVKKMPMPRRRLIRISVSGHFRKEPKMVISIPMHPRPNTKFNLDFTILSGALLRQNFNFMPPSTHVMIPRESISPELGSPAPKFKSILAVKIPMSTVPKNRLAVRGNNQEERCVS